MEVHFTPEQESQLAQVAIEAGIDAERLVKDAALRLLVPETHPRFPVPELPVWSLGAVDAFHRRDLYDDVV